MARGKYKTISLREELIKEIDQILEDNPGSFVTRAEFVKEAVRQRILVYRGLTK